MSQPRLVKDQSNPKPKGGVIKQINEKLAAAKKKGDVDVTVESVAGKGEELSPLELATQKPVVIQGELPTMETPKDKEIIRAAEAYRKVRDERIALTATEVEKKAFLHALMNSKGLKYYSFQGLTVEIIAGKENVKVKIESDEEADG